MNKILRNIRARYKNLEKITTVSDALTSLIGGLTGKSPKRDFKKAVKMLDLERGVYNKAVRYKKSFEKAVELGVEKPATYQKTLDKQIKKAENLKKRQNNFMDKQRSYNHSLKPSQKRDVLNLTPVTPEEITEAYKLLNSAKRSIKKDVNKPNFDKLNKLLSKEKKENENKPLIELSRNYFDNSYKDYIYIRTSIEQAENSEWPELAKLFRAGGGELIENLRLAGFTLFEYANSLTGSESSEDMIRNRLDIAFRKLNQRNKALVLKFLEENR